MESETLPLERRLADSFLAESPREAARALESFPPSTIAAHLTEEKPAAAALLLEEMEPERAADAIAALPDAALPDVFKAMNPLRLAPLLARMPEEVRDRILGLVDDTLAGELREILAFPEGTAGHLMDPRFLVFPRDVTVNDVIERLHSLRERRILDIPLVDDTGKLCGLIPLQEVILSEPGEALGNLIRSVPASVNPMASREEVVELLTAERLTSLPVIDFDGRLVGMIRHDALVQAIQEEASADVGRMVGVSREERALSSPFFSVRKRLPWLNINLLTAFLAAAVVGLFENIIAQVTALAVLLPVVAGQSGNTGAQALAVTMRGLALREVRTRQWPRLVAKEALAGAMNGLAIAIVTSIGVLIWSGSMGLCLVIGVAMVIAMTIAGVAGAAIPVLLSAMGQDPAQSSSIVLTTVTDVFGFFSFLGLATLFASYL